MEEVSQEGGGEEGWRRWRIVSPPKTRVRRVMSWGEKNKEVVSLGERGKREGRMFG